MKKILLALLFSLSSPLLLIPIEKILPYPYLIEEITKLIIVKAIFQAEKKFKKDFFVFIILTGVLFSFSESILYLTNIFLLGDLFLLPKRLVSTTALHLLTIFILYFSLKKGNKFILIGLGITIFLHYLYNRFVFLFF